MKARFDLGLDDTVLPKGTRVIVRVPVVDESGEKHRAGFLAVVRSVDGRAYTVETPAGSTFILDRASLDLERADLLQSLAERQWDERRLRDNIIYAAVVGSKAWGLDDANSDEDVRGCFVLPFEEHASLYDAPDEIHEMESGTKDAGAYWEIEKLVRQALRADPNTLEMLWSPIVKRATPLGQKLVDARAIFSSQRVVLSFGRYAQTQLDKLGRAGDRARATRALLDAIEAGRVVDEKSASALLRDLARSSSQSSSAEDVHAIVRSLFDRGLVNAASMAALVDAVHGIGAARLAPEEVRPKNAYNLVRLLASCAHWLEHAAPLMRVDEPLRSELLAIKHGVTPLDVTIARARDLARAVDDRAAAPTKLPADPDVDAADRIVREARREMARVVFAPPSASTSPSATMGASTGAPMSTATALFALRWFPAPLPRDVDPSSTRRFLEHKLGARNILVVGLTGAHAYGFPSPDSDLDLKAIHSDRAEAFLGLSSPPGPIEVIEIFEGREMDLSSHELGMAGQLILKGNGNMLERLLGPLPLVITPAGERLASIAQRALSSRVHHHYLGFLHGSRRESDREARDDDGARSAKRMLYCFRVACTGAHLLRTGALVTDVTALAPQYGFAAVVDELRARKNSAEYAKLAVHESKPVLAIIDTLAQFLDDARAASVLPQEPPDDAVADLEALLLEARLA